MSANPLISAIKMLIFLAQICYIWTKAIFRFFVPLPLKSLEDEVILITGTANGIGRAICMELAPLGAQLVCWDLDKVNNQETVRQLHGLGCSAVGYTLDVSDRVQVALVAAKVKKDVGPVTIIINNAGLLACDNFLNVSPERIEKIFQVNVLSHFWILKEFLPQMLAKNEGHVVSVASAASFIPTPYVGAYAGSKGAVMGYMDSLRQELLDQNSKISLTTVYPYACETGMVKGLDWEKPDSPVTTFARILTPDEVAQKIVVGLRQCQEYVYIPGRLHFLEMIIKWIPPKVGRAITNFGDKKFQVPPPNPQATSQK